jgi:hypothetical protein
MKESTNSLIRWLFLSTLTICIFLYLKVALRPELIYHAQQPPFLFDSDFFSAFTAYAGGLSKYTANFLMQFFFYLWAGPFILLAISLLLLLSGSGIARLLGESNQPGFLMAIPFILSIALINNYYFPYVVIIRVLMVFMAVWLFGYLVKKKIHTIAVFSPLALVVYYLAGSGPVVVFALTTIVLLPFLKFSIKQYSFFSAFTMLFVILIYFISVQYMPGYNTGMGSLFSFLPDMDLFTDAFMNYKPGGLFHLFCYALPFLLLIMGLKDKIAGRLVKRRTALFSLVDRLKPIVVTLLTACLAVFLLTDTFNRHQKNIVLTDYYCYHEQWKEAIKTATSDPEYNVFMNYDYNRAIDNYGKFSDLFFNYPQYHVFALFPDRIGKGNPGLALTISDYYFDLGYISISQQWAYGAMALIPYNPRALKRLVLTNLIYGNYYAAHGLLNVLSENPVSRDFVAQYMPYVIDTTLVNSDKMIMEKRISMPTDPIISDDITERFEALLARNNHNKKAYEHLQMCYLLVQNLDYFVINLPAARTFYSQLPPIFEQALLTHVFVSGDKNVPEFEISRASREKFSDFILTLKPYNDNKDLARQKLNRFANTFMYYAFFYGPPDPVSKTDHKFDYQ